MSGVSHGLGLGLGLSHIVELWFWCLQGLSLSLGGCYCPGCTVMVTFDDDLVSGVSHGLGLGLGFSHIVSRVIGMNLNEPHLVIGTWKFVTNLSKTQLILCLPTCRKLLRRPCIRRICSWYQILCPNLGSQ